jgi:hydrogenase/urease accessory protein HupE
VTKPLGLFFFNQNAFRFYLSFLLLLSYQAKADVVKPALVEISVYSEGSYRIEIRTSIEAILTGINSRFTNTTQSPNAKKYDELRALQAPYLLKEFQAYQNQFMQHVGFKLDNKRAFFDSIEVNIPDPGYTKIPRTSLIILHGKIEQRVKSLSWHYPAFFSDNAVRVRQIDNNKEKWHWSNWQWLRNDQWSQPFSLTEVFHKQSIKSIISTYTQAGFEHIVPRGLDHILFVLGIFLFSLKLKAILWQVTLFTLAHSITLSLAMMDIWTLPATLVEPLIALSIAYIGIENLFVKKIKVSRLIIVFAFGLLHGMGFASMLADFGVPNYGFFTALMSFNFGVEIGQLFIIAITYALIVHWCKNRAWYRSRIVLPSSFVIGLIGIFWCYDRLLI